MGYKKPQSQKMKQEEGKISAINVGRLDTLRENVQKERECRKLFP
jgi:hypothetical protein